MRDKLMRNTQNNNYLGSTTSGITIWTDIIVFLEKFIPYEIQSYIHG